MNINLYYLKEIVFNVGAKAFFAPTSEKTTIIV